MWLSPYGEAQSCEWIPKLKLPLNSQDWDLVCIFRTVWRQRQLCKYVGSWLPKCEAYLFLCPEPTPWKSKLFTQLLDIQVNQRKHSMILWKEREFIFWELLIKEILEVHIIRMSTALKQTLSTRFPKVSLKWPWCDYYICFVPSSCSVWFS